MFSHIYVEEEIREHPLTLDVLNKFPKAIIVTINNYKNVFNPSNQNFQSQKLKKKLILAKKKDNYIYKGSALTDTFHRGKFYYNTLIMNCLYNCDYCYLQGMYNSSHIVIFVNLEDFFSETEKVLREENKITLCISYDTDLLALERYVPYTSKWIEFAKNNPNLTIEIRTKSNSYIKISHLKPIDNVILAWTLSPDEIVKDIEKDTPTLNRRLKSLCDATSDGWNTRICLDPILYVKNWKNIYSNLISKIVENPELKNISDITFGVFRINSEYLKKIKKMRVDSKIIYHPYKKYGSVETYKKEIQLRIEDYILNELLKFFPKEKIFY
jgi:spore photoproduct lyase